MRARLARSRASAPRKEIGGLKFLHGNWTRSGAVPLDFSKDPRDRRLASRVHEIVRIGSPIGPRGLYRMRIAKVVVTLGALAGLTGAFFGCGTSRPNAANGDGTFNGTSEGCTTPGQTRECHYIVSEDKNVRTCAAGTQTCLNGYWSGCGPSGTNAPSLLQSINVSAQTNGGLKLLNVNPVSDAGPACANPCDPACSGYNEACTPDAGSDGGTSFPPTTYPACESFPMGTQNSCDCTAPGDCKQECTNTTGCLAIARSPKKADFKCDNVSGLCDFKCEPGTDCKVDCKDTATCSLTCLGNAKCRIKCDNVANCPLNCAPGADCKVDECKNGSSCPRSDLGGNICFQTPPFSLPAVSAPGAPPGFVDKLLADKCNNNGAGVLARICEVGPFAVSSTDVNTGRMASTCQADSYCEPLTGLAGLGCCKPFSSTTNETHATQTSDGLDCVGTLPDLTTPGACKAGNGDIAIAICNRGNADAVGPMWMGEDASPGSVPPWNGGTTAAPTCYPNATAYKCRYDGTIKPGECAIISKNSPLGAGCGGNSVNGNSLWFINPPAAPNVLAECTLQPKGLVSLIQPAQPGCANNMSVFGSGGSMPDCVGGYTPTTITQDYVATCAPGQRPKWTTLGWQGTVPAAGAQKSKIEFYSTVQGTDYDGGLIAPLGPFLVGRATQAPYATYPDAGGLCSPASPTTNPECPKQFSKTLGAAAPAGGGPQAVFADQMKLTIVLYPSPDGKQLPILQNWWVSYTCVDYE